MESIYKLLLQGSDVTHENTAFWPNKTLIVDWEFVLVVKQFPIESAIFKRLNEVPDF